MEHPKMQIEYWPLDKLQPYARNPRKNDEAVPKLAGVIREFCFKVPIVCRSSGEVIKEPIGEEMKALVLSSGGIDSTTCVGVAVDLHGSCNVVTLSLFYGQRHEKELEAARQVAKFYGLKHYELDLSAVFRWSDCPLLAASKKNVPLQSYAEQIAKDGDGKVCTYVPFRNGLFLSSAASVAMSLFPEERVGIYIGAHADDAAGDAYADCSPDFTGAMGAAISIGTYQQCQLIAPFVHCTKVQVVKKGLKLKVPYEYTWSCYTGGEKPCGRCGTCIDRSKAFEMNNASDPALR